jgi:ribosomal protein L7Ae-like RNA K-turn-binding protein
MIDALSVRDKRIANYVGLAQRAGKIAAGDVPALSAVKNGKAKMLLIADDAANQVKEVLSGACRDKKIKLYYWQHKAALGYMVGKSARGALAVLDAGFAVAIEKLLQEGN